MLPRIWSREVIMELFRPRPYRRRGAHWHFWNAALAVAPAALVWLTMGSLKQRMNAPAEQEAAAGSKAEEKGVQQRVARLEERVEELSKRVQ